MLMTFSMSGNREEHGRVGGTGGKKENRDQKKAGSNKEHGGARTDRGGRQRGVRREEERPIE